jgi:hypothetical protein
MQIRRAVKDSENRAEAGRFAEIVQASVWRIVEEALKGRPSEMPAVLAELRGAKSLFQRLLDEDIEQFTDLLHVDPDTGESDGTDPFA